MYYSNIKFNKKAGRSGDMKVAVCQGEAVGGFPKREELLKYWKQQLSTIPEVHEIDFYEMFDESWAGQYDAVIGAWIRDGYFGEEFFRKYPKLKYIATLGHGFGKIDELAARRYNVTFTNTVYGDMTIAQFGFGLLMDICHHIGDEARFYKQMLDEKHGFAGRKKVCTRQIELYEKTMGIIGLGNIGLWMARMAQGFGMHVVAYSRHKKVGPEYKNIEQVSFDELLARSDVISIHCPLTDQTRGMIDRKAFSKMKDGVIIINTARGAIIDEQALIDNLKSRKVYAAGLDVVDGEPVHEKTPIFDQDNATITAHIAWAPEEARYRTVRIATENLRNWIAGVPTSVIA
jgi:glycerate dehydrogenase